MTLSQSLPVTFSRLGLAACFLFGFVSFYFNITPHTDMSYSWLVYLFLLYLLAERLYYVFLQKKIDLSFAFPLLLVIYILHFVSMTFQAQEKFPLLNRTEHLASYVFLTFIIWTFFHYYLPHSVWRHHPYYTAILVFSIVTSAGVLNEIVELSFDGLLGTHLIGNKLDTSLDLLMNSLGSFLFLATRLVLGTSPKVIT